MNSKIIMAVLTVIKGYLLLLDSYLWFIKALKEY